MKHYIKVTLLMAVTLMVLTACQNNTGLTNPDPKEQEIAYSIQASGGKDASPVLDTDDFNWPLRNIEAGYVQVSNDVENLYVTYYLRDEWQITGAQLQVGFSMADIPVDELGYPSPADFDYQTALNRGVKMHREIIALSQLGLKAGDAIVIVSRATLSPSSQLSQEINLRREVSEEKSAASPEWWSVSHYRIKQDTNGAVQVRRDKEMEGLSQNY